MTVEKTVIRMKVPKGKRKPIECREKAFFSVSILCVEPEEFPLAYIVHHADDHYDVKRGLKDIEYRVFDGNFFQLRTIKSDCDDTYLSITRTDSEELFIQKMSSYIVDEQPEDKIQESIQQVENEFIIYKDAIWTKTYEPVYSVDFSGGSIYYSITHMWSESELDLNIYRGDEMPLIQERIQNSPYKAENKKYWMQRSKEEYIEVGDIFFSELASRDDRQFHRLSNDVNELLCKNLGGYYYPGCADFAKEMSASITKRLWTSPKFDKDHAVYEKDFFNALYEELGTLYGMPFSPAQDGKN